MNNFFLSPFFSLLLFFLLNRLISEGSCKSQNTHALTPPRGWNSYDSFSWIISEQEFLQNAKLVSKRLHAHGYEYVVVDYLWYRRLVPGSHSGASGFDVIDEWGRMVPDPDRWPSSKGGKGFTEVAKKVHSMGLKFGIHVMRGVSWQAVNANTPILDTTKGAAYVEGGKIWKARDIGMEERVCNWMRKGFMGVNTKLGAGRAFLRSLYEQYAEWGVDFVKHDCVFGDDLDIEEISFVSEVLSKLSRPIIYSLSPGVNVTTSMAKEISGLVNMYRITGDDWDNWTDVALHFDIARDFAAEKMIGSRGLFGKSWPDLDMLPLGWLTDPPGGNLGPHRKSYLNLNEQRTQITLWAMVKSPLMFGGDMRKLDKTTYNLITNPTVLEINAFSSHNQEFPFITESSFKPSLHLAHQEKVEKSRPKVLVLVNCQDREAKGWLVQSVDKDYDQFCWKNNNVIDEESFCLYKRKAQITSDEDMKTNLMVTTRGAHCIDASPRKSLASSEVKISPCSKCDSQMWEFNKNDTLVNSDSGLCAAIKTVEVKVVPSGVRSWVATGRRGVVYMALFNLDTEKKKITAQLSNLKKVIPSVQFKTLSKYREVWSGQHGRISEGSISMDLEPHGAALFVLTSTNSS